MLVTFWAIFPKQGRKMMPGVEALVLFLKEVLLESILRKFLTIKPAYFKLKLIRCKFELFISHSSYFLNSKKIIMSLKKSLPYWHKINQQTRRLHLFMNCTCNLSWKSSKSRKYETDKQFCINLLVFDGQTNFFDSKRVESH